MRFLTILMFLGGMAASAQADILCVDQDPINGKLCLKSQVTKPDGEQKRFIKRMRAAVGSYMNSNCIPKDGSCISDMTIQYCDRDIQTCSLYGEILADTGTFYVYRMLYSVKSKGWIVIDDLTKTYQFGYPN